MPVYWTRLAAFALFLACSCACTSAGDGQESLSSASSPSHAGYLGNSACSTCHQAEALSYAKTAHSLTSQRADAQSILGSFASGSNVLMIADPRAALENPGLYFRMERRDNRFFETAVAGWPGKYVRRSAAIDLVIGSGVRGQSYLYWQGDQLFELPVSYWSDGHRWINSPGYQNGTMDFSRPVLPRCLECHATYIHQRSSNPLGNTYDRDSLVVGISCETCHGPGRDHADRERKAAANSAATAPGILNPASLSRDRQIDICALCHNGLRDEQLAPSFSFTPGEELSKFLQPDSTQLAQTPNVHGNQVGLLRRSRCYLLSPNMACSTCHDIHAPERPAAEYSARCLNCHQIKACGMSKSMGAKIADDCIDCHMPLESTTAVVSQTAGDLIRPKMRTHWIRVYPTRAQ